MPHSEISNSDHQFFFGALSKKEDDFSWIINQVLRIFWFQALRKPRFENKGNFWIKCVCIKAFVSWYTHRRAFTSLHTHKGEFASWHTHKGAFTSWHTHKGAFTSWHTHKWTFTSWHAPKGHLHHDIPTWTFTSWHTYMNICIMAYPPGGIYIMAYLHEHLHHGIPTRAHLHHDIPTRSICIMTCPLEGICTTRHFASPSL